MRFVLWIKSGLLIVWSFRKMSSLCVRKGFIVIHLPTFFATKGGLAWIEAVFQSDKNRATHFATKFGKLNVPFTYPTYLPFWRRGDAWFAAHLGPRRAGPTTKHRTCQQNEPQTTDKIQQTESSSARCANHCFVFWVDNWASVSSNTVQTPGTRNRGRLFPSRIEV